MLYGMAIGYHGRMAATLKAICFDLDGLLVDTEPSYYEALRSVFAEYGCAVSQEEYARRWVIRGTRTAEEALRHGITADPEALSVEVKRRFTAMVERELKLMPHARETLEQANRRFVTALVTNTPRGEVELILSRAGLSGFLQHLVTREEYRNAKPAPDCYLTAARLVGVSPVECLALEDSARGVHAAVAAGIPCVAVLNEMTRYEPPEGALQVLQSLTELDLDALAARWPVSSG